MVGTAWHQEQADLPSFDSMDKYIDVHGTMERSDRAF